MRRDPSFMRKQSRAHHGGIMVLTRSAAETEQLGSAVAGTLKAADIVCLSGDLGSGKTTFVRGLARGYGYAGLVRSPSFAIVNEYEARRGPLYHMDLYRVRGVDLCSLGLDDYLFGGGLSVIEWADRMAHRRGYPHWAVSLKIKSERERAITLQRCGA